ncbi:MAG: hypothetical protein A2474_01860 [Elusimicrobia bacterium RIFOXYC2_FULL_34_12]|nr:MAG: hypothetical protein A2474_01860 [Elusimicrobia bacterium RIFOXYC2_FULL_34_12]OGS38652.1 MAG: hypothetical protein A2551_06510 [Elusimicrobia bacterium RIFOXYD2_FULL_34_30]HAM39488.1 hypothetical protein [Elusimicrobiota bacterium]
MKLHGLKTRGIFCFRIPRSGILPEDHSSALLGAPLQAWSSGCRINIESLRVTPVEFHESGLENKKSRQTGNDIS